MAQDQEFDRRIPLAVFLATSGLLALHHWYVKSEGEIYLFVVFIVPMFWALGLVGIFHPPLTFVIGRHGRDLPASTKAVGLLCAVGGLVMGYFLATKLYGF